MRKFLLIFLISIFVPAPFAVSAQGAIQNNFYVDSGMDYEGRSKVASTLRHESFRAYFYVEDNYYTRLSQSEKGQLSQKMGELAENFDTEIYPVLTQAYGSEPNPGIDNDSVITILITKMRPGITGYFMPRNQEARSGEPASNEREMLYLNSDIIFNSYAKSYLAHEFVHLIEYNQKGTTEQTWLSEGMSEYAPTLLGYNVPYEGSYLQKRAKDFIGFPSDSLELWREKDIDMASSSLFTHYLVSQYGESILKEIMQSTHTGRGAVNDAVAKLGRPESFEDIFIKWHITNYANGIPGSEYAYDQPLSFSNLHVPASVQYSMFTNSFVDTSLAVQHTSALWIKFFPGQLGQDSTNTLHLKFDAQNSEGMFAVRYIKTGVAGYTTIAEFSLSQNKGSVSFEGFGTDILSVVLIPVNYKQTDGSTSGFFNLKASLSNIPAADEDTEAGEVAGESTFSDGVLLRANGDPKVYVYKKDASGAESKRWIPSPEIFNGYGHLRWSDIINVEPSVLSAIPESRLIKFIGDYRVYEISENAELIKQWLDITPAQFDLSGRSWSAIFEVNQNEFDRYSTGNPMRV
ncbi:MAG: hypothetical protein WD712_00355 [Candidatus Spechtbacterales bacterium]